MASARSAFAGPVEGSGGFLCWAGAARPSAVVQLLRWPLLPRQSPSQQMVFAGRFHRGYTVWYAVHQRT